MKTKFTIFLFLLGTNLFYAQEVMIHYNFTMEKDYNSTFTEYIYSDEVEEFDIKVYNQKKILAYHKSFSKNDFIKGKYGDIMMTGFIYGLQKGGLNTVKIAYKLRSKIGRTETFKFSYPDSVSNLALEIFFDQAKVIRMKDTLINGYAFVDDEYEINSEAKPVLIVKYWSNEEKRILEPTWFDFGRLTVRPDYIFKNNSLDTIYHATDNIIEGFMGNLKKLEKDEWVRYLYGGQCGTTGVPWKIKPGEQEITLEGFPIGSPRKLTGGLYRFSFPYSLQKHVDAAGNKDVSTIHTYFIMMYAD